MEPLAVLHEHLSPSVGLSGLPTCDGSHPSVAQPTYAPAIAITDAPQPVAVADIVTPASKCAATIGCQPVLTRESAIFDEQQSSRPAILRPDLAAEGAHIAAGIVRQQHLRDMLSAIEEFWHASDDDRDYWRGQAGFLIREWRRCYAQPERAAFNAAVARSRAT